MRAINPARKLFAYVLPVALAACGGGGGGGDSSTGTPDLTVQGEAATHAAAAGGQIDVKCATGSTAGSTEADGSFRVTVTAATLPCVLRLTIGETSLYSVATTGTGTSALASLQASAAARTNINPFTHLIAAMAAGMTPDVLFDHFDADAQARLTAASVNEAKDAVAAAMPSSVQLADISPLSARFSDADDLLGQLTALGTALDNARTTLQAATSAAADGDGSPEFLRSVLLPPSPACAGLRSGHYRVIESREPDAARADRTATLDLGTMTVTYKDASTSVITNLDGCSFGISDSIVRVARSGIMVAVDAGATSSAPALVIPDQNVPLRLLAGTWNILEYQSDTAGGPLQPAGGQFTLDAQGRFTAGADCTGMAACEAWESMPGNLTPNPDGGFDVATDQGTLRLHPVRTGDGNINLFALHPNARGIAIAARQQALAMPVAGTTTSTWDFSVSTSGVTTVAENTYTITVVDTAARRFTRERVGGDGRIEELALDVPRNGLRHREAGDVPTTGGGTLRVSEVISMSLQGTGVGLFTSVAPNQNFFGISIVQP